MLYLGEVNDQQQAAWQKTIEIFEHGQVQPRTVALFADDGLAEVNDQAIVRVNRSSGFSHGGIGEPHGNC